MAALLDVFQAGKRFASLAKHQNTVNEGDAWNGVRDSGFPGVDVSQWYALFVPAGASREVVSRLNGEINAILQRDDIRSRLIDLGYEPVGNGGEQFAQFVREEISRYREIIRRTNVTLE
jgi:tripartite-type tricarboxylate transporter receptor subunit TctC